MLTVLTFYTNKVRFTMVIRNSNELIGKSEENIVLTDTILSKGKHVSIGQLKCCRYKHYDLIGVFNHLDLILKVNW